MNDRVERVTVVRSDNRARLESAGWEHVLEAVIRQGGATLRELCSRDRSRRVATLRHVAMFLGRKLTGLTLVEIGAHLGGRDHTTVLYGVQRIEERLRSGDQVVTALVAEVERLLPATCPSEWAIEVVDGGEADPVMRVVYHREDGSRWAATIPMERLD